MFAISNFAKEILDVVDNLGRAIEAGKEKFEGQNDNLYEGINN